ncbi:MAG: hypothetical protein HGA38_05160 [Candidatus Moranbacteria bacterium]|nr:hypothetical protein [Candidatus Moranbacteria bacterium]NTW45863.1 hypothetical protein [Candidatus Moranbacteria bacterium]
MKNWVLAPRPFNGFMVSVTVLLGFHLTGRDWKEGFPYSIVAAILYSAIIVWNDYCDREMDPAKGKRFANEQGVRYLSYAIVWWAVSLASVAWLWIVLGSGPGMLALGLGVSGFGYTWAQRNAFAKNGLVAVWTGAVMLFPVVSGADVMPKSLWLVAVLTLANYGREILKDAEDVHCDTDKDTLATRYGSSVSAIVALFPLVLAAVTAAVGFGTAGIVYIVSFLVAGLLGVCGRYRESVTFLKYGLAISVPVLFL